MDYGLSIPTRGVLANASTISSLATRAEALGYAHLAVPDHLIVPRAIDSRYPYSDDGSFPGADNGECMEQFSLLSYLAAITKTPRLLTSVTVVPHRGAIETAKLIATIDALSGGRFTFGVGAGWMEEEFRNIQTPPFEKRGKVTNEVIEACKVLWTEEAPAYAGEHFRFENVTFLPKPVQDPHPPIWVGGESPAAMRRTVNHGDAWYPIHTNPHHPLNTATRFTAGVAKLHELAEKKGRDPRSIGIALFSNTYNESTPERQVDGEHHLLTGPPQAIVDDIGFLRGQGVETLVLNFQRASEAASIESMERFMADIAAAAG